MLAPAPRRGAPAWIPALLVGLLLMFAASASAYGLWTRTDLDGDGLTVEEEWNAGTDPVAADTDRDGLEDGWEFVRDINPLRNDTDLDTVADRDELDLDANPLASDTDGDGLLDAAEGFEADCNANGVSAARDDDDDSDARHDGTEPPEQRCDPDADNDTVLDGRERAQACITVTDCDTDGLDDAYEARSSFDALNPDTFGVGLEDAILDAFQRRGQDPSGDQDGDGIPDGWEGNNGLIEWGDFAPANGTRDLLIEFVRVSGPDSGRYVSLSLNPAYDAVKALFQRESNIRIQWVETSVVIQNETRPTLIPSSHSAHYAYLLSRARYSSNPYVTTVVMNPQHDISEVVHAGVAPIRGMLAAVDYGGEVTIRYRLGSQTLPLTPLLESAIDGNRLDLIQAIGWQQAGRRTSGEMFVDGGDYIVAWQPYWFRTTPRVIADEGDVFPMTYESATINTDRLAFTIAHEIGHTLGLCHLDLSDCLQGIAQADLSSVSTSTMHPSGRALHFLPSEWQNAARYMACPPHGPVRLIANNASRHDLIEEKYGYALNEILNVGLRKCGDYTSIRADLVPYEEPFRFSLPASYKPPAVPTNSSIGTVGYWILASVLVLGATLGAASVTHRWIITRRNRPPTR